MEIRVLYRDRTQIFFHLDFKVPELHVQYTPGNMRTARSLSCFHYNNVIMGAIASQTTSLSIVYSIVNSDADQRKYQSSASLAFVWGIHRGPVNSPHKGPVTRKMFPFDDVIMLLFGTKRFYLHVCVMGSWGNYVWTHSISHKLCTRFMI